MNELRQTRSPRHYDDEIDLRALFRILWSGKWLIGGITFAVTTIAVIVSLMLPDIYRAEALLAPNDQSNSGGLSALAAQYGGLATLTGINLGNGRSDKTALGLETLKSRRFISSFVERRDILVPLIAAAGWDSKTGELIIDPHAFDVKSQRWIREVSPPRKVIPSSQEAYDKFMAALSVGEDKKTGFVTIAIEHYSPTVTKQWVDWLIEDLNASIMEQDVALAEQSIEYLNDQIKNTPLADLRTVFYRLIEEQMKTVMLAKVSDEYLLKTIDPAVAPEMKSKPKRSFLVILAAILGSFFSVFVVLILEPRRRKTVSL